MNGYIVIEVLIAFIGIILVIAGPIILTVFPVIVRKQVAEVTALIYHLFSSLMFYKQ